MRFVQEHLHAIHRGAYGGPEPQSTFHAGEAVSYTDCVDRPHAEVVTGRRLSKLMRGHRFNGYYMKTWGFQLRRFADRKQLPRWLHRARSADIGEISDGNAR
jgi:hypothetical protein